MEAVAALLKKWWIALILGIIAIGLGIYFMTSGEATVIIPTLFCIFLLLVGIIDLIGTIACRNEIPAWGWNLVLAILIIVFSILCIAASPWLKTIFAANFFSLTMIFQGIYNITGSVRYKQSGGKGWGWLLAFGILTLLVGFWLFTEPFVTMFVFNVIAAVDMFVFGVNMISASIVMSKMSGMQNMD